MTIIIPKIYMVIYARQAWRECLNCFTQLQKNESINDVIIIWREG